MTRKNDSGPGRTKDLRIPTTPDRLARAVLRSPPPKRPGKPKGKP